MHIYIYIYMYIHIYIYIYREREREREIHVRPSASRQAVHARTALHATRRERAPLHLEIDRLFDGEVDRYIHMYIYIYIYIYIHTYYVYI